MIVNCGDCGTHMPAALSATPVDLGGPATCPECVKWQGRAIVLRADHPYAKTFSPCITGPFGGVFLVKWRDFSTMKQDREFATREEAEEYRRRLISDCRIVKPWLCGGSETFEEMNAFWEPAEPPPELPPRDDFYRSRAWRELRYRALKRDGARCVVCGRTRAHGVVIHVDHIEPRSKRPDLELVLSNLQVMCDGCNLGKGNRDSIDWRVHL